MAGAFTPASLMTSSPISTERESPSSISALSRVGQRARRSGRKMPSQWGIRWASCGCKALISVQGFDCFCCHIAPSRLAALKRGLERDPNGTLQAFWRSCGAAGFAWPEALNVPRLEDGLNWLSKWDVRRIKEGLRCPVLALASRDDPIVPESMSEAIWGNHGIVWSPDGGHVLPLMHPRWCARHVLEFARALPS